MNVNRISLNANYIASDGSVHTDDGHLRPNVSLDTVSKRQWMRYRWRAISWDAEVNLEHILVTVELEPLFQPHEQPVVLPPELTSLIVSFL